jgi:two-component system alkaline phosphatase synthesis response regulator PhoP
MTARDLRILLVEKDVTTADLLMPTLERKGYEVAVAQTPRQAMGRIRSLRPDLLFVDVASFGANGYAIGDALRAVLHEVPTMLMLPEGHAGAGGLAQAFLTPPFSTRKLLHRLKKLAGRADDRTLRAGHLLLDPDTRTLSKGETSFHLRPKEAALLAYLMRNAGRVLGRPEIIREIWQTEYIGDTRTLTVHIRWLREKIEDDPDAPCLLRTVRGMGYRFEVPESEPVGSTTSAPALTTPTSEYIQANQFGR